MTRVPFLWPHNADPIALEMPDGADNGFAYAINNDDKIVGSFDTKKGALQCFVWTAEAGWDDISSGLWKTCKAVGVNSAGQIAGWAAAIDSRAFLWDQGLFIDLGVLPDTSAAQALAINDDSEIVGIAINGEGNPRAFMWNGSMIDLDPQRRSFASMALSINNRGEIVGWTQHDNLSDTVAVRFVHSKILRLDSEVVNLAGWELETATSINDKGVIVGSGVLDGESHAFMLMPQ